MPLPGFRSALPRGSVGVEFDDFAFVLRDDDVAEGFFDLGKSDADGLLFWFGIGFFWWRRWGRGGEGDAEGGAISGAKPKAGGGWAAVEGFVGEPRSLIGEDRASRDVVGFEFRPFG